MQRIVEGHGGRLAVQSGRSLDLHLYGQIGREKRNHEASHHRRRTAYPAGDPLHWRRPNASRRSRRRAGGLDRFGDGTGYGAVVLDQKMPGLDGLERSNGSRSAPDACVLMVTAFASIELAVDAMRWERPTSCASR
jgi:hypothetical protein